MSVKQDWDRTSDHKKAGENYTRIFGTEDEVKARRRKWIAEQKKKRKAGAIEMIIPDEPNTNLADVLEKAHKTFRTSR